MIKLTLYEQKCARRHFYRLKGNLPYKQMQYKAATRNLVFKNLLG